MAFFDLLHHGCVERVEVLQDSLAIVTVINVADKGDVNPALQTWLCEILLWQEKATVQTDRRNTSRGTSFGYIFRFECGTKQERDTRQGL